jgi:hypothetical protein
MHIDMGSAKEDMCERIPSSNCAGRGGSTRQRYGTRLPVVVFFLLFFRRFSFGGLLGPFVSAVLQVTYGSAARRILSRASERRRRPGECCHGLSLMKASR